MNYVLKNGKRTLVGVQRREVPRWVKAEDGEVVALKDPRWGHEDESWVSRGGGSSRWYVLFDGEEEVAKWEDYKPSSRVCALEALGKTQTPAEAFLEGVEAVEYESPFEESGLLTDKAYSSMLTYSVYRGPSYHFYPVADSLYEVCELHVEGDVHEMRVGDIVEMGKSCLWRDTDGRVYYTKKKALRRLELLK